ncbi:MAG TPA: HdeD family acid-resistance protein [Candidatus Solibacter sp.]|jgi:uncharacterized membrane protein HdeD (DUF308 family)|nr:HdeD family acid-resistance protein [Candidatus Solibacter sp.]
MITNPLFLEFEELRHKWGWFLALGIAMLILGTVALLMMPIATVAAVMILGWVMVVSGVVEAIHAFRLRGWGGFFLHLIGGVLGVLIGLLIVTHPVAGAIAWTLLFASFFTVIGIFRMVAAVQLKFPHWGWAVFDGAITLLLGIVLSVEWPWSGLWFLGLSVAISLLLRGWSYVMISLAVRAIPPVPQEVRRAA